MPKKHILNQNLYPSTTNLKKDMPKMSTYKVLYKNDYCMYTNHFQNCTEC